MPVDRRRPEGFTGQHLQVLPHSILRQMKLHPLLSRLFPTAAGYFPEAPGHLVERPRGIPDLILIACLSGAGWLEMPGHPRVLIEANEALFIAPQTPHAYGAHPRHPWSIMWAHCAGAELPHFQALLGVSDPHAVIRVAPLSFQMMDFAKVHQYLEQGYSPAQLLSAASHLRFCLAEIHRLRTTGTRGKRDLDDAVDISIQWMRKHPDEEITLQALARQAGCSAPHYSTLFRRKTGFAPMHYFLRLKIQQACRLLDTSSLRVHEVARAGGWQDPYYFSRFFKKVMGHSPRAYRQIPKG